MPASSTPLCPDCNTALRLLDVRRGKEDWICPVAEKAKERGLLGKPGRKHKELLVYSRKQPTREAVTK